jgi:hypothetical protein
VERLTPTPTRFADYVFFAVFDGRTIAYRKTVAYFADDPQGLEKAVKNARETLHAVVCEPWSDFYHARGPIGSAPADFARTRCHWLIKKGKGMIHPRDETLAAIDEVFYVDGDPHPVDGMPTLLTNRDEAAAYCRLCFPELGSEEVLNKIKSRKLYGVLT